MSKTEILSDNHELRIKRLEDVLSKVIAWNVREYGTAGVEKLLDELHDSKWSDE